MDWLLPLRAGDHNDELRHALRSWELNAGLVHGRDRLVVVGDCPSWLRPEVFIPGNERRSGPTNVYVNIREACTSGELGDQAIVVNDDMYAMEPADPGQVWHRGPLFEHVKALQRNTWWFASMRQTLTYVRQQGVLEPLSYELHRPLLVDTERMGEILSEAWRRVGPAPQWRTVYGNMAAIGGTRAQDGKVIRAKTLPPLPWWSTTDGSWRTHEVGDIVRATFPEPSSWETDSPNERLTP